MEVSFSNACNFACSYCNASFSTTWQTDIKTNGAYQNLTTDGAGAFHHAGDDAMIYGKDNKDNPYIEECGKPLIGCDLWEHAYYLKYQNDREKYLKKWFELINWDFVNETLESYK